MKELFSGQAYRDSKCPIVTDPATGKFSRVLTAKRFYQVGSLYSQFWEDSTPFGVEKADLPSLSSEQAVFISSAYSLPYPLATIIEYRTMMSRVCKNDEKRLSFMKYKVGRTPAATTKKSYKAMEKSFFNRCANIAY